MTQNIRYFPLPEIDRGQFSGPTIDRLHPVARQFADGIGEEQPDLLMVEVVDRIIRSVIEKTVGPEYSVDEDGALSFEALLSGGLFIMCEVSMVGNINAGLYQGPDGDLVDFLVRPTLEQLLELF